MWPRFVISALDSNDHHFTLRYFEDLEVEDRMDLVSYASRVVLIKDQCHRMHS